MGVSYDAIAGLGTKYDNITFESLTELAQTELLGRFIDDDCMVEQFGEYYDDEAIWSLVPKDDLGFALEDYFESVKGEFLDELGFTAIVGKLMSGEVDMSGGEVDMIGVELPLSSNIEPAVLSFKKYINIEPEAFIGVLQS